MSESPVKKPVRVAKKSSKNKVSTSGSEPSAAPRTRVDLNEFEISKDPSVASTPKLLKKKKKKAKPVFDQEKDVSVEQPVPASEETNKKARKVSTKSRVAKQEDEDMQVVTASEKRSAKSDKEDTREDYTIEPNGEEESVSKVETPKRLKVKKRKKKDKDMIELERKKIEESDEKKKKEEKSDQEEKTSSKKTKARNNSREEEEEGDGDDYADDFEDYDEDFEDFGDDDIVDTLVKKATKSPKPQSKNQFAPDMSKSKQQKKQNEDKRAASGAFKKVEKSKPRVSSSHKSRRVGQENLLRGNFGDFDDETDAVGIQVASDKVQSKRVRDLKKLIQLQQTKIDLFEQHSLPPWEFYIRTVAAGGTHKQSFAQTNDDACEVDTQTDSIQMQSFFSQGEDTGFETFEMDGIVLTPSQEKDSDREEKGQDLEQREGEGEGDASLQGLSKLCELAEVYLESNRSMFRSAEIDEAKVSEDTNLISETRFSLEAAPELCLHRRKVVEVSFSQTQSHIVMVTYDPSSEGSAVERCSLICVWDLNTSMEEPIKVLVCQSRLTCSLLGPVRAEFVVAGCEDGSLFVWDLRKAPHEDGFYHPSFCTSAPTSSIKGHECQVVTLRTVHSAQSEARTGAVFHDGGFQLASLDEEGEICVWTLLSLSASNQYTSADEQAAGAPETGFTDPGVFLHGRVKLQLVANLSAFSTKSSSTEDKYSFSSSLSATSFAFHPSDPGQVFVTCTSGSVLRCARFGNRVPPSKFSCTGELSGGSLFHDLDTHSGESSTCIEFHPVLEEFFLVGFSSGALALYHSKSSLPLKTWSMSTEEDALAGSGHSAVACVRWSQSCPTVAFVMDAKDNLYVWDFAVDDTRPVVCKRLRGREDSSPPSGVVAVPLAVSSTALPTMEPSLAAATSDGSVWVYRLGGKAGQRRIGSVDQLESLENTFLNIF